VTDPSQAERALAVYFEGYRLRGRRGHP
jgi:hypothetical protein